VDGAPPAAAAPLQSGNQPPSAPTPETNPAVDETARESVDRGLVMLGAARNAVRAGKLPEAFRRYERYLADRPDEADVREEYGNALAQALDVDKAVDQYELVLKQHPDRAARLRAEIGNMYIQTKRFRSAIAQFSQALLCVPKDTRTTRLLKRDLATQLARAYAFDGDPTTAFKIFEDQLGDVEPNDVDAPRLFGGLLLDLDRPKDAVRYLEVQRARHKADLEVLAYLTRARAAADDLPHARKGVAELFEAARGKVDSLLFLAAMLASDGETALAAEVYGKVLEIKPTNQPALLGLVDAAVAEYRLADARRLLQTLDPEPELRRKYLGLAALTFVRSGEYADAKAVYKTLLEHDPADDDARLGLAGVEAFLQDHEQAIADFQKVDATKSLAWRGRAGVMRSLVELRRFSEALQIAEALLAERRRQSEAVGQVVDALVKAGKPEDAVKVCREFIACSRTSSASAAMYIALGRALLAQGKSAEALVAFDAALEHRAGRIPAAYYGRAKAQSRGPICDLGELFAAVANARGGQLGNYLALADLFAEDHADDEAIKICEAVLQADPLNLAAWGRLVEARQRIARQSGDTRPAIGACNEALKLSPTNTRAWTALARAFATGRQYDDSVQSYDRLLAIDPDVALPRREKARVLNAAAKYDRSDAAYRQVRSPTAGETLHVGVSEIANCDPVQRATLQAYLVAGLAGDALANKLGDLCCERGCTAELARRIRWLLLDYRAKRREEAGMELEREAKSRKGLRDRAAIACYCRLLELEPANAEAAFDLAQVHGTLQRTANELLGYARTLEIDSQNRDAMIASDRASRELNPQLRLTFALEHENGRSGLADITRVRWGELVQWPLGDEGEFLRLGAARVSYHPALDRKLDGNILTVQLHKRAKPDLLLFADVNYEHYSDRLHSRPTWDVGAEWSDDWWTLRGEALGEFVLQNGEALRQDIWRAGGRWSVGYRVDRRWDLGAKYGYWRYSDGNDLNEYLLAANYKISFVPRQLTATFSIDGQSFREPSVFVGPGDSIVNAVHPYFTPRGFVLYQGRLTYTEYLSRDYFLHANTCWYTLQYGLAWDSEFVNYHILRGALSRDCCSWLTLALDGSVTASQAYTGAWFYATATLRWPILTPCCP
jgi:tetratricopeptide (TPR) repeat protein